jgi:hypothetical protein
MHGDDGWYAFSPEPFADGAADVYYWSMDPADLDRVPRTGWWQYLEGQRPNYPEEALQREFGSVRDRVRMMRDDTTTPDTRLSDDPMHINPARTEALVNLMLGGMHPAHQGAPLHCRVRYFNPVARRAGMPQDVAALVEGLMADGMTLTLVNVNQIEPRTVIVQGGAYGEHQFQRVTRGEQPVDLDASSFAVRIAPGAGARLTVRMRRYDNPPTLAFPWDRP